MTGQEIVDKLREGLTGLTEIAGMIDGAIAAARDEGAEPEPEPEPIKDAAREWAKRNIVEKVRGVVTWLDEGQACGPVSEYANDIDVIRSIGIIAYNAGKSAAFTPIPASVKPKEGTEAIVHTMGESFVVRYIDCKWRFRNGHDMVSKPISYIPIPAQKNSPGEGQ